MKVKLSEKAASTLLDLYNLSDESGTITHFLNKLISDYKSIQFPPNEDTDDEAEQERQPR